jgi:hypothetical protein
MLTQNLFMTLKKEVSEPISQEYLNSLIYLRTGNKMKNPNGHVLYCFGKEKVNSGRVWEITSS